MVSVLKRIAKQLARIAIEIENSEKLSSLNILKRIRLNLEDIEKDIDEGLFTKMAQTHVDYLLSRYYRDSESTLTLIKHAIEENSFEPDDKTKQIDECITIRNIVLRIIKKLDNYYKSCLNSKFNYHSITHTMLNDRINDLKKSKNDLDKSINKLKVK